MLNLLQKFLSKNQFNKSHVRENFSGYFYSLPEHEWLREKCIKDHFEKLFSYLPIKLIENLMSTRPVVFIRSEEMNLRLIQASQLVNLVVVFPEFQKLLNSNKKSAVAYLAHELAFVLLELEGLGEDKMMAEIEADKFVSDLGLTFELEEFLLMLDETVEKRVRLTYLTLNHFKNFESNN